MKPCSNKQDHLLWCTCRTTMTYCDGSSKEKSHTYTYKDDAYTHLLLYQKCVQYN